MLTSPLKTFLRSAALTAALLLPLSLPAQTEMERGLQAINQEQAENYLGFLADDLLEGRDAGMRGGSLAANYIVSLLREWGIRPLHADGYFQHFDAARLSKPDRGVWQIHPDSICKISKHGAHHLRHMKNILAAIPGKDTAAFVVVGAHYDHEGIAPDIVGDGLYNGADDNASGVTAVMQIAKAFLASGKQPERTVIFAFWDGEEKGLLGSRHFVRTWEKPQRIKAYLNFDMVGRGPIETPRLVRYFYTAAHTDFERWLKADMKTYGFDFDPDYKAWERPVGGSDNASFALADIPIVWYHTEGHPDYTRPSDSADKIDFKKLTEITRAAFLTAWRMANEATY